MRAAALPGTVLTSERLAPNVPASNTVVAVVLRHNGKIALFKRSRRVAHDGGLWHCITGYVETGKSPSQQALDELREEAGLETASLTKLDAGPDLIMDDRRGQPWLVHTFVATTSQRRLRLDWEHDSYRWTSPCKVKRFTNRVSWLDRVLAVAASS